MSTRGMMKTLAFHHSAQGKSGTTPELSVKPASQPYQGLCQSPQASR